MARKKVTDLNANTAFGFGKGEGRIPAGQEVSGYYLGKRPVQTSYGPSVLHVLDTPEGNVGYYGSSKLNDGLSQVKLGSMVWITFLGKAKKGKPGMSPPKLFKVEFDDEDTINVGEVQTNFADTSVEEPDYSAEGAEAAAEDNDDAADEVAEEAVNPVRSKPAARTAKPASAKEAALIEAKLRQYGR